MQINRRDGSEHAATQSKLSQSVRCPAFLVWSVDVAAPAGGFRIYHELSVLVRETRGDSETTLVAVVTYDTAFGTHPEIHVGCAMADSTTTEATTKEEDLSIHDLKKTFHDTQVMDGGVKKSVWKMTMETFGMAEGKSKDTDFMTTDIEEGLTKLKSMIPESSGDDGEKWKFPVTPLGPLDATLDDYLRAFVVWSNKVEEDGEGEPVYNVDKAFRRLESYASWMYEHREDLQDPLTAESMVTPAKAWAMSITHSKKTGHLLWWIDFAKLDIKAIKESVPLKDSLRYFVWVSHIVMLDKQAQAKGLVFLEGMAKLGMWESMTMVPMDLGTKLDRLTIGSLPVKMKACYMFQGARWIHIFLALIKPFLSQKMRSRLVIVPDAEDVKKLLDEKYGHDSILNGFAGVEGGALKDVIFGKYLKAFFEDPDGETEC